MLYLFFYNVFLAAYWAGVRIVGLRNKKAAKWVIGRRNWSAKLEQSVAIFRKKNDDSGAVGQTIWMHCSSLGEFEQGRPVIEKLKAGDPGIHIVVSFFSPSGYEVMKNYPGADVVCYLPMDNPANAADFIKTIEPTLVLWVKYEYWYYYLKEIHSRKIPLLLISGIFRPGQPFFKWYGKLHREMLQCFTHLFVQNEASQALAAQMVDPKIISISGDTRFDRVIAIAEQFNPLPLIEQWLNGTTKVLVAGSTWDEDEKELTHYVKLHPEIKFIVAPHNINEQEIKDVQQLFPDSTLFSALQAGANTSPQMQEKNVLIIDNIGMLSSLYHYATVAYIGGGFGGDGVHNVLEAAVYYKPVLHGPEFEKYAEAKGLIEAEGAFELEDALELEQILNRLFTDAAFYSASAKAAGQFIYDHRGATQRIVDYIVKSYR
ncbi:MAG: glycosyltransferase N-terminal domain-containing protein [Chitinophagaceae bacterium]